MVKYARTGELLRKYRREGGMNSLHDAGEAFGINHNTQGNYERGDTLPGLDYFAKFSQRTGVGLPHLINAVMQDLGECMRVQCAPEGSDLGPDLAPIRAEISSLVEAVGALDATWITLLMELRSNGNITQAGARSVALEVAGINQ